MRKRKVLRHFQSNYICIPFDLTPAEFLCHRFILFHFILFRLIFKRQKIGIQSQYLFCRTFPAFRNSNLYNLMASNSKLFEVFSGEVNI